MIGKLNKVLFSSVIVGIGLTLVVLSKTHANESGFTFSPMSGKYYSGQNRNVLEHSHLSLGLGYEYASGWGVEAAYLSVATTPLSGTTDVDVEHLRLDALYHFGGGKFRPYFVFGAGQAEFSSVGVTVDDGFADAGIGFKYAFGRVVSLRADARYVRGLDSGETDYMTNIGLEFKFGQPRPVMPVVVKEPVKKAPADSDADGVPDAADACPGTTANVPVDQKGCEVIQDEDNDGIVDALDKCPKSAPGSKVDEKGCYIVLKEDVSVSMSVNFASNSDRVIENTAGDINDVAKFLVAYPNTRAIIEGHTDDSGAAEYNRQLSQRRAEAVVRILVHQYGIAQGRLTAIGYGEERPLVNNSTAGNRAKNRRVTAVVSAVVEKIAQ